MLQVYDVTSLKICKNFVPNRTRVINVAWILNKQNWKWASYVLTSKIKTANCKRCVLHRSSSAVRGLFVPVPSIVANSKSIAILAC